ncbi:type II secretion system F family protein [soil metagenome]
MDTLLIVIILVLLVLGSVALILMGTRGYKSSARIEERLAQYVDNPTTMEELELMLPFSERVLAPVILKVARSASRLTPRSNIEKLKQNLLEAGSPSKVGPSEFLGLRLVVGGVAGGAFFLMFVVTGASLGQLLLFPLVIAGIGYMIPGIWLSRKIKARKNEIQMSLPDAIDLLTISVEAGLGFDPALQRVAEKWDNELTREFRRMLSEIRMGKSRREALREMANRVNIDDLNVFIASVVQADQLGVSISQVLRVQSKQMRLRRRQRAEEKAHKAPIKMLFPMILLIFPAMYVVILGPAIPQIMGGF